MKDGAMASPAILALAACESHPEATDDRSAHVWSTDQRDMATDRVRGKPVPVSTAVQREYGGETCYFANEDHAREFMAYPEKYEDKNSPSVPTTR